MQYTVTTTIQTVRNPENNPPVGIIWHRGENLALAIAAMVDATVKGERDPEWTRLISVQLDVWEICAEGVHVNDDNPGRPICRTCDNDPAIAALYPA